ncbi:MAG: hypothetical protein FJ271_33495 [Planctomycetes bacterium]|nr:hypothetical protein [Planctomycetota bacterium]
MSKDLTPELVELSEVFVQMLSHYRDDLRDPPPAASRAKRIEMVEQAIVGLQSSIERMKAVVKAHATR